MNSLSPTGPPSPGWQPGPPIRPPAAYAKPRRWWFVLAGGLLVAAVVGFVVGLVLVLSSFFETDARFPADGEARAVQVDTDGDRALWFEQGASVTCEVEDSATGDSIDLRGVSGTITKQLGDRSYRATQQFAPGSGDLVVACVGDESNVHLGPAPSVGGFAGGIVVTIVVPLVLFLAGVAVLVVTIVRTVRGRPRT